jgi:hypothetical protein
MYIIEIVVYTHREPWRDKKNRHYLTTNELNFQGSYKNIFAVHLKRSSFLPSADLTQCNLVQSCFILSACVYRNLYGLNK